MKITILVELVCVYSTGSLETADSDATSLARKHRLPHYNFFICTAFQLYNVLNCNSE